MTLKIRSKQTINCILEYGNLQIVHVFYDYEFIPVIFVLCNDKGQLFFGVCTEYRREQRWIITPVSLDELTRVASGEMDTNSAFTCQRKTIYLVVRSYSENDKYQALKVMHDDRNIPNKGIYLDDIDHEEYDGFVEEYETEFPQRRAFKNSLEKPTITFDTTGICEILYKAFFTSRIDYSSSTVSSIIKSFSHSFVERIIDFRVPSALSQISYSNYHFERIVSVSSSKIHESAPNDICEAA